MGLLPNGFLNIIKYEGRSHSFRTDIEMVQVCPNDHNIITGLIERCHSG